MQERGDRYVLFGLLVAHHGHSDAAVRVAAAAQLAPVRIRTMHQVREVGERTHEADGEPVANGFADSGLLLHVVRQMGKSVALGFPALVGNRLVTSGKGDRLEREERNLLRIIERELDNVTNLLVVDTVQNRDDRNDVDARRPKIFNGPQLYIEQVAYRAVRVGRIADSIELQVRVPESGFGRFFAEIGPLGEFDAVGGRLHAVIADLAGVANSVNEIRRKRRLAA